LIIACVPVYIAFRAIPRRYSASPGFARLAREIDTAARRRLLAPRRVNENPSYLIFPDYIDDRSK
jgi:hypothetical protein